MKSDITITLAAPNHAKTLARMHQESFDPSWTGEDFLQHINRSSDTVLIAQINEAPIGFIVFRLIAPECEIISLVVDQAQRKHGVGTALMNQAVRKAQSGGVRDMYLDVAIDNQAALALYEGMGFQRYGLRPRYYRRGNDKVDAYMLRKSLVNP